MTFQHLRNALLTMADADFDAVLLVDVFGKVLGRIDGTVLTTGATKGEHQ